jgi:transposase
MGGIVNFAQNYHGWHNSSDSSAGRPKGLTNLQLLQLKNFVTATSIKPDGGRLQGKDVQAYIETEFNVNYQKTNVYHLLHGLNLSWITTRSKHPKQSVQAQEAFKKILNKNDS